MTLPDFILSDMEAILVRWEAFARTQAPAATNMSALALRDHAREILEAIAADLSTYQTREAQLEKSLGHAPKLKSASETAAQAHAVLRVSSGFNINQLVAEYRALRASVLRLWLDAHALQISEVDDVVRFNEAIDQAISESVHHYSAQVEESRNLFLGMLGHDLRTPLHAIQMTASYLAALNAGPSVSEAAARIINGGARMTALLDDLIDFNRAKLGLGIRIVPTPLDIESLFSEELALLRAAHPSRPIALTITGETNGIWDGPRLRQALGNLVTNAIKYGDARETVQINVMAEAGETRFEVRNMGPALDPSMLHQIFEPLNRGSKNQAGPHGDNSLGLGLFIVREIVNGHGGSIDVQSDVTQTVFTVRLPRFQRALENA